MRSHAVGLITMIFLVAVVACGRDVPGPASEETPPEVPGKGEKAAGEEKRCDGGTVAPAIAGFYKDGHDHIQVIGDKQWVMESFGETLEAIKTENAVYSYCTVNNSKNTILAYNAQNHFHPDRFSQFNWTYFDNRLWFCQVVADARSREAAAAHTPADSSNPAARGCGNFAWTALTPEAES